METAMTMTDNQRNMLLNVMRNQTERATTQQSRNDTPLTVAVSTRGGKAAAPRVFAGWFSQSFDGYMLPAAALLRPFGREKEDFGARNGFCDDDDDCWLMFEVKMSVRKGLVERCDGAAAAAALPKDEASGSGAFTRLLGVLATGP